jgi:CcmD family protein
MNWLVVAYSVFFIAIFGYTLMMSRKQKDLDRRIEELRSLIKDSNIHE